MQHLHVERCSWPEMWTITKIGGVNMSDHRLVSASTCARALGVTTGCLYRMAREGLVPSYRVGVQQRGVRFDVEEVKKALRRDLDDLAED